MAEKNIIIAGFGGQGILMAGEILANAFMIDGKNVTWFPCYGAEMRGGTVNCEIVTSEEEVSSVNKKDADFIIALNQLSFDKFLPMLKKGGWMIANSSLVGEIRSRIDVNYLFAPITNLANELGDIRITNVIALGLLAKIGKLTSMETLHGAIDKVLPEHRKYLLALNLKALQAGFDFVPAPVAVSC